MSYNFTQHFVVNNVDDIVPFCYTYIGLSGHDILMTPELLRMI